MVNEKTFPFTLRQATVSCPPAGLFDLLPVASDEGAVARHAVNVN